MYKTSDFAEFRTRLNTVTLSGSNEPTPTFQEKSDAFIRRSLIGVSSPYEPCGLVVYSFYNFSANTSPEIQSTLSVFALGTRLGLDLDISKSSPSLVQAMVFSHCRVSGGLGSDFGPD